MLAIRTTVKFLWVSFLLWFSALNQILGIHVDTYR